MKWFNLNLHKLSEKQKQKLWLSLGEVLCGNFGLLYFLTRNVGFPSLLGVPISAIILYDGVKDIAKLGKLLESNHDAP